MKTYHIKDLLKKELLIVEIPEDNWITVFPKLIWINDRETGKFHHIKGSYTLLGSPDEIKEEDVLDLVDKDPWVLSFKSYRDYSSKKIVKYNTLITALESFNSALESEIYWNVNPISKELGFIGNVSEIDKQIALQKQKRRFTKAQEKTFNKKRTLIFVKN